MKSSILKGVNLRRKQQRQGKEIWGTLCGMPVFTYKGRIRDNNRKKDRREQKKRSL